MPVFSYERPWSLGRPRGRGLAVLRFWAVTAAFWFGVSCWFVCGSGAVDDEEEGPPDWSGLSSDQLARQACSLCHVFPEPTMLTRTNWHEQILPRMSVELGVFPPDYSSSPEGELIRQRGIYPGILRVRKEYWPKIEQYFMDTAPDEPSPQAAHPAIGLDLKLFRVEPQRVRQNPPTTSLVKISPGKQQIYVGDDQARTLAVLDAAGRRVTTLALGNVPVDVVEADGGIYVTCIGSFMPSEVYAAEFKFIESKAGGFDLPRTILKGLPRSVQAQFADFNGDGREDFTLCMYGNRTGRFSWFENKGDGKYEEHLLMDHSGAMYCHVRDFNKDGTPDMAVLYAQELEMLVLSLNDGKGQFTSEIIFQKPPVFGHSWFEPVDFNGDSRLDLLVVNGDNGEYDSPTKNYHGIRVYLNESEMKFREAWFYPLNGAYKALARDFDQDGDLDIAAISFFPDYVQSPRESFVYLENKGRFNFTANTFRQCIAGRWLVMDAGDLDGDGDLDLVLGSHVQGPKAVPKFLENLWNKQGNPILILRNQLRDSKTADTNRRADDRPNPK